jgi:hypothetical protein
MKLIMSINYKFMKISPSELINKVKNTDINGFEVCFNIKDVQEVNYVTKLAKIIATTDLILQFHGDSELSIEDIYNYLNLINEFSKTTNKKCNIVFHSIFKNNIIQSMQETIVLFNNILEYVDKNHYNLSISIENLNNINNEDRLNKDDLIPILKQYNQLYFTYDIGHELVEYHKILPIAKLHLERLNNIHIHSFHDDDDHQILNAYNNKELWLKAINYINEIKYSGTLVFEYNLYCFNGDVENKIDLYIKSICNTGKLLVN